MKRFLSAVVLGALVAPVSSPAQWEAEIGDFHRFECNTPDGKRLKPKFGNIDGVLYVDLPALREDCHAAVTRRISQCGQNTSFASNTKNREYPECLPIFEAQARECEAFFRSERPKCDTCAAGAATGDEAGQAAAALSPKCSELPGSYPASGDNHAYAQCWQEIDGRPGCFAYRDHYHSGESIRMSGECRGGVVERGTLTINYADGGSGKGPYVDGERNGRWVIRFANGNVFEGPYVNGKQTGRWVIRSADGRVQEGPVTDGKQTGRWNITEPHGSTWVACYRAGEQVNC